MDKPNTLMRLPTVSSLLAAALLGLTVNGRSATFDFQFNTLPSSQGWQYSDPWNEFAEGQIYSLVSDSLGNPALAMDSAWKTAGFTAPHYSLPGVVNPTQPFQLSFRAAVSSFEGRWDQGFWPLSFQVFVCTGDYSYGLHIGPDRLAYGGYTGIRDSSIVPTAEVPLNNTIWRNYRIEGTPGQTVSYFADDVLIASVPSVADGYHPANGLIFGDALAPTGGIAVISSLTFTQVPEPGASALAAGVLMLGCAAYRRWRRTTAR